MNAAAPATSDVFVLECIAAIGDTNVLRDPSDMAGYLTDWRKRYTGQARAVLRPGSTEEVAEIVRIAARHNVAIVPQGGNTGLSGGATPDESGSQAVVSLSRMRAVRAIDPANNTITVEAGCVLADMQRAARESDRLFPLSLAAEGSCTIGGNLSTNAGGTAVLAYGTTRELCLGLEVVTASGEIWSGLRGLRKDNTGYDLRDLFIGAEGTLGIITAAVMKLYPLPAAHMTALAAVDTPHEALKLLEIAQRAAGPLLTGFELMSDFCLSLVGKHFPDMRYPFAERHGQVVLLELSDNESEEHARNLFESLMQTAFDEGVVQDAVVAQNLTESRAFWNLREHIPLAQAEEGLNIKHDIAVPISRIGHFIDETAVLIAAAAPGSRMVVFGHLGDGNLHYNVQTPEGGDPRAFLKTYQTQLNRIVYDNVVAHHGTISAEHGIGKLKVEDNARVKTPVELSLMRALKHALDPHGRMNPGKVIADA
ncbi:FAD-binding oxidoreductase [Pararobbsia alpina]|uniref:FAD-binding oxidoreductase n=1 Tax=Pararobbsia alpina TaxID=621374 RepID=UPI0039A5FDFA